MDIEEVHRQVLDTECNVLHGADIITKTAMEEIHTIEVLGVVTLVTLTQGIHTIIQDMLMPENHTIENLMLETATIGTIITRSALPAMITKGILNVFSQYKT